MSISTDQVEKIAALANLNLSEEEKSKFTVQLNTILEYVEKLNELDTEGVSPLSHPLDLKNVFRKDEIKPSLSVEEALENAPARSKSYFKVPRVIWK